MSRAAALALLACVFVLPVTSAQAADPAAFVERLSGEWLGTGQLLFGPQFGTKFHCELAGTPRGSQTSFAMNGRCWMGEISGPVHAQMRFNAQMNRFYGEFMDGGDGDGVDIEGAPEGDGFALKLSRGGIQGKLTAEAVGGDQMKVILSIRDKARSLDLPVIAMGFTRKSASALGLPAYLPGPASGPETTGSIAAAR